jgi:NADH-quinone oxidoreductase subunit M
VELLLFLGFFSAFAVKAPLWPLHSWAPDAYVESPVGVTMILVALKMGLYGFMRFNVGLFPNATLVCAPYIVAFAVIGVIAAALIASVQPNMKRLIAYSSVSHIGVIVLAIFALTPTSWTGATIQMVSHTFTVGGLFLLLSCLYLRRKSYEISDYGGVAKVMPFFMAVFVIATLSSIALPGTSGFTGEFLMLIGSFNAFPIATAIATTSAIWSAVYMLWMVKRAMHGAVTHPEVGALTDLTPGEKFAIVPIVLVILWIGLYSAPLCNKLGGSFGALASIHSTEYRGTAVFAPRATPQPAVKVAEIFKLGSDSTK